MSILGGPLPEVEEENKEPNYIQVIEEAFPTTNLTGRALHAQKLRNKRIAEGNTGIPISEVPKLAWDTGVNIAESMASDPAAMSEHTLDLYADFQAASKGFQAGSKFGPWGAGGGAVGAVVLRRGGKELVEKVFGLLRKGDEYVDAATGMKVDPQDATYFMSKGSSGSSGGKITDLNADKLSVDELKNQLDDNISFELGYNPGKIKETPYKAKLKAADGTIMPSEIATPFVRHGEAFLKANPTKTLEEFPHLWWKGEAWVLKGRNRYKTVNGKRQFVRKEIQIERWTDRKARAKLGKDARSLRIKEQSAGIEKGTFAYEKVKQLRERNIKREAAGLPPLRLRDSDLDHINALRSVDYYTKDMPEDFKKLIYQDLGKEGLFTGDHASNLKLREREVHRALWPELKRRLNLLGHKHTGFKTPEARYNYYKEINPKTGVTRLEEYAETVYAVEELGDDMMEELLTVAKQKKQIGKRKIAPSDPVKDALIKILGSEEDYKTFMDRLREVPPIMRKDFIIEEIKYHE